MKRSKKAFLCFLMVCIMSTALAMSATAAEVPEVPEASYESWSPTKLGEIFETITYEQSDEIITEEVLLNLVEVNSELFVKANKEIGAVVFGYYEKDGVLHPELIQWQNAEPYDLIVPPSTIRSITYTKQFTYYHMVIWDEHENESHFFFKISDGKELINHPDTWAKAEVDEAIAAGLIPLELQDRYKEKITRADFSKLIVKFVESKTGHAVQDILEEQDIDLKINPFSDTNLKEVVAAYRLGIVNGKGNGKFDPDGNITRQEAAIMLTKAAVFLGYAVASEPTTYIDNSRIAAWAVPGVEYVSGYGIMNGTGGNSFSPEGAYTRQQAYLTILRLYHFLQ